MNNIRKFRESYGLTQSQVAEKIGVSLDTVSRYETEKREPRASDLCQMAKLFSCSIDELLGRSGTHEASDVHQETDL